jgi:hypothetical protein
MSKENVGFKDIAAGIFEAAMSYREGLGEVFDASKPMFDHGRTELAAAIFSGHGHVMYMHADKEVEQPHHGLEQKMEDRELEM